MDRSPRRSRGSATSSPNTSSSGEHTSFVNDARGDYSSSRSENKSYRSNRSFSEEEEDGDELDHSAQAGETSPL